MNINTIVIPCKVANNNKNGVSTDLQHSNHLYTTNENQSNSKISSSDRNQDDVNDDNKQSPVSSNSIVEELFRRIVMPSIHWNPALQLRG